MTNKELCDRYPWLIPTNRWTDRPVKGWNYEYTELDAMPEGWRLAFGEEMCEEIDEEIKTWPESGEDFRVVQIKEKFGMLCFYTNFTTDKLDEIINKYMIRSRFTCIRCGHPAKWVSRDWISPWCENCARHRIDDINEDTETQWEKEYINIKEYFGIKKED